MAPSLLQTIQDGCRDLTCPDKYNDATRAPSILLFPPAFPLMRNSGITPTPQHTCKETWVVLSSWLPLKPVSGERGLLAAMVTYTAHSITVQVPEDPR